MKREGGSAWVQHLLTRGTRAATSQPGAEGLLAGLLVRMILGIVLPAALTAEKEPEKTMNMHGKKQ